MENTNIKMQKAAPFLVAAAAVLWGILVIFVRKLGAAGFSAMEIVCIRSYGSVCFLFPGLVLMQKIFQPGRSQESILQEAVSRENSSRESILQEGVSRESILQEAVSRESTLQESILREGVSKEDIFRETPSHSLLHIRIRDTWCFVGTGIFSIVFFSYCYFRNVEISSAAFSSILMYTSPVWVLLMSMVCFRERLNKGKVIALALAFAGCVLVSGILSGPTQVSLQGILLGLGSGIGYGLYTIFGQYALNKGYHPMTVAAYTFLFACAGVLPFVHLPDILSRLCSDPMLWLWGILMSFLTTTLSFSLYTLGLQYMEPGRAAVLATLEPIVSAIVGVIYYKELLTTPMFIGIVLVLAASILISRK